MKAESLPFVINQLLNLCKQLLLVPCFVDESHIIRILYLLYTYWHLQLHTLNGISFRVRRIDCWHVQCIRHKLCDWSAEYQSNKVT